MQPKDQALEVWGELACFTRPELKVERYSYPVITPSAARGIYEAIYAKPRELRWQITGIEILAPPAYIALRRNETKEKVSMVAVQKWMRESTLAEPIWADGDERLLGTDAKGRTQRQTMALKNVHYCLHAEIRPWPEHAGGLQGMEAQFRRRAATGKCVYQPYFGCREFPAYFELVEPGAPPARRAPVNLDLGMMLYDVFDLSRPGASTDEPAISLFRAAVEDGYLAVPPYEDSAVEKTPRR
ncbi:MAG: type I-C CRISPR-associated protein Cas5 [Candidatus Schekmanbacteria bacterium]|nr:type I-C CRISPR-associated protein Cas5 [Candidatus Schekmanbacteria bacterium]